MKCWGGAWYFLSMAHLELLQQCWKIKLFTPFLQMRKLRPRKPMGPDSVCVSWMQNRIKYSLTAHQMNVLCHRLTKNQVWTVFQSNLCFLLVLTQCLTYNSPDMSCLSLILSSNRELTAFLMKPGRHSDRSMCVNICIVMNMKRMKGWRIIWMYSYWSFISGNFSLIVLNIKYFFIRIPILYMLNLLCIFSMSITFSLILIKVFFYFI